MPIDFQPDGAAATLDFQPHLDFQPDEPGLMTQAKKGFQKGVALAKPVTDMMHAPAQLISQGLDYIFPSKEPFVQPETIKRLETGLTGGVETPGSMADTAQNWIAQQGSGLTDARMLAALALAKGAPVPVGAAFAGQAAEQAPQAASSLYQAIQQKQPEQALTSALDLGASVAIPAGISYGLSRMPSGPAPIGPTPLAERPVQVTQSLADQLKASLTEGQIVKKEAASAKAEPAEPMAQPIAPQSPPVAPLASPEQAVGSMPQPESKAPINEMRPAVRTMDGQMHVGEQGMVHDDIINRDKITATDVDRRVFVDAKGNEVSREQLAGMGVPETGPTPGAHADELARQQVVAPEKLVGSAIRLKSGRIVKSPPGGTHIQVEDIDKLKQEDFTREARDTGFYTNKREFVDQYEADKLGLTSESPLARQQKLTPAIQLPSGEVIAAPTHYQAYEKKFGDVRGDVGATEGWTREGKFLPKYDKTGKEIDYTTQIPTPTSTTEKGIRYVPEQQPAIKTKDGLVITDTAAQSHADLIDRYNVWPSDIAERGHIKDGKFVSPSIVEQDKPSIGKGMTAAVEKNVEHGGLPLEVFDDTVKKVYEGAKVLGQRATTYRRKWAGWSAPRTVTANEKVGNALINYAVADDASAAIAKSKVTDVLGEKFRDKEFSDKLGKVLVQDRLDAIRQQHLANNEPDLAARVQQFVPPDEMKKLLADPEIKAAIERHKQTIQPIAQQYHEELGGKLARGGQETGAFVNLKAMLGTDDAAELSNFVYGSRRGDVTAPLRRGTAFGKTAKGTGEAYITDYRTLAERMLRGNYREAMKKRWFDSYVESGLGVVLPAGSKAPTIDGKPTTKIPVTRKIFEAKSGQMAYKSENLWVRSDLADEASQALQTDSKVHKAGLALALEAATDLQIIGPTDFTFHIANMYSSIAGSVGAKTGLGEHVRSIVGPRQLDALGRIAYQTYRAVIDSPEVQKDWAEISRIGAGREYPQHRGLITHGLEKAGLEKTPLRFLDPQTLSNRAIQAFDKAGRLALNNMYDNLVERGLVKASDVDRREFINKMGQYHGALMSKFQQFARDFRISPFVTAGRTFNRLGVQRLLADPGVRAAGPMAAAQLRYFQALKVFSTVAVATTGLNMMFTGKPMGRPGTQPGRVDLGMDDDKGRHITVDVAKDLMLARGLRVTGLGQIAEGVSQGRPMKESLTRAGQDIFTSLLHPWEGPAVRTGELMAFGRTLGGPVKSPNPYDFGENVKTALKNVNPTVAAMLEGKQEGGTKGAIGGAFKQLGSAAGITKSRPLTGKQRAEGVTERLFGDRDVSTSLPARALVGRVMQEEKPPQTLEEKKQAGQRAEQSVFDSRRRVTEGLSPETQKFLQEQRLLLPGFKEQLHVKKLGDVYLSDDERKRFEQILTTGWDTILSKLATTDFTNRSVFEKQQVINAAGKHINAAARKMLEEEIKTTEPKAKKRRSAMFEE